MKRVNEEWRPLGSDSAIEKISAETREAAGSPARPAPCERHSGRAPVRVCLRAIYHYHRLIICHLLPSRSGCVLSFAALNLNLEPLFPLHSRPLCCVILRSSRTKRASLLAGSEFANQSSRQMTTQRRPSKQTNKLAQNGQPARPLESDCDLNGKLNSISTSAAPEERQYGRLLCASPPLAPSTKRAHWRRWPMSSSYRAQLGFELDTRPPN